MDLKNKIVLLTGASSGIGEATARELARRGARLVLVARRESELQRVALDIETETGLAPTLIPADLTLPADRLKIRDTLEAAANKNEYKNAAPELHVLINNAGITAHGRFDEMAPEVLRKTFEINFFAMSELTSLLLPLMKKTTGNKAILLVSTPSGLYGVPGRFAYSASKAAGHALIETLRLELGDFGFQTGLFCPGYVKTNLRSSGLGPDGKVLQEEQARGARTPEEAALKLLGTLEKNKRIAFLGPNGPVVYWLRTLAPGLLERIMARKLKKDFVNRQEI